LWATFSKITTLRFRGKKMILFKIKKIKRLIAAAHRLYYCFTRYNYDHEFVQRSVIGVVAALEEIDAKKYNETFKEASDGFCEDHGIQIEGKR